MRKLIWIVILIGIGIYIGLHFASGQLANPTNYWKLNEANNTLIANDSMNVLNLSANLSTTFRQTGKLGNALRVKNVGLVVYTNATSNLNSVTFGTGAFSIIFWINTSDGGTGYNVFSRSGGSTTNWGIATVNTNGNLTFNSNSVSVLTTGLNVTNGTYNRIAFVREGTGANLFKVYVNGRNTKNGTLANDLSDTTTQLAGDGANSGSTGYNLDDIRVYKGYALTPSDINADWNNGNGQELAFLDLALNSPTNAQTIFNPSFLFNATSNPTTDLLNVTNITYYIYYQNNSLFQVQTNTTLIRNNSILNISGFTVNNYFWDAYACGTNTSGGVLCFNSNSPNRTFTWGSNLTDWFSNPVVEGSSQTIYLNVTIASGNSLTSSNLIYGGTTYAGTISQINSTLYQVSRTLTTPLVINDDSRLFNWNVTFQSGFNTASTIRNQTIIALNIGSCSSFPDLILNYSVFDEDAQTRLTGSDNVTIQVYVELSPQGSSSVVSTYNRTYHVVNATNTASVCASGNVLGNGTYSMNVITDYISALHEPESYDVQNFTLNSTTGHLAIDLYDLLITNAQQFKIRYLDRSFIPVPNVVIEINRFYTGLGRSLPVEATTTGNDGSSVASLVLNDEVYTFIVKKNGQNLSVFPNLRAFCNSAISECTIDLPARTTSGQITTQTCSGNICISSPFYNSTTRTYSFNFNSIDSSTNTIVINITNNVGGSPNQLCYNSIVSSSGSLSCVLSINDINEQAYARISSNGLLIASDSFYTGDIDNATFGTLRILLAIGLIVSLAGVFSSNPVLSVFGIFIGFAIAGWLYLINVGGAFSSLGILVWLVLVIIALATKGKSSTKEFGK